MSTEPPMAETAPARTIGGCVSGICSMATREVLSELAAAYARQTGQRVAVESVGGVDAIRRVEEGEAFDFVVLAARAIDKLGAAGRIDPATRIDIARSGVASSCSLVKSEPGRSYRFQRER